MTPARLGTVFAAALAPWLALAGSGVAQELLPLGGELQVNTTTASDQLTAAVAMAPGGSFVVVWASLASAGSDTSSYSVQGRRFAADGTPVGDDFQVNTSTGGYQFLPDVAVDGAGRFVVVWASQSSLGGDSSFYSIQGQRFAADGTALGGEFQVNTYSTDFQSFPAVAAAADGGFVVVWHSVGSGGDDFFGRSIQGQRYAADGTALGGELQVNAHVAGDQVVPDVDLAAGGEFVVTWFNVSSSPGDDTSGRSVAARRFAADGAPAGGDFQVNTTTTSNQYAPRVSVAAGGDFVVVWSSDGSAGSDADGYSVQGQRFAAGGEPLGSEFQVNTYTPYYQLAPAVAGGGSELVVAWASGDADAGGPDGDRRAVALQAYRADGAAMGGERVVNSYTTGLQTQAAVAADGRGGFVVAWRSDGSAGDDGDGTSIQVQRYRSPLFIFADGFESGDTSAWGGP